MYVCVYYTSELRKNKCFKKRVVGTCSLCSQAKKGDASPDIVSIVTTAEAKPSPDGNQSVQSKPYTTFAWLSFVMYKPLLSY